MLHFCLSRINDISKKDVTFPCRQYLLRRRFNLRSMATNCSANDHSVAFVTCPNENVAKKIARGLVEKKLAACVNVIPKVTSIYVWEGSVEEDSELLLKIKTRTSIVPQLAAFVRENHPYDVPEVISIKIDQGNEQYLKWMSDTVPKPYTLTKS